MKIEMRIDEILSIIDLKSILRTPSHRLYDATQPIIFDPQITRDYLTRNNWEKLYRATIRINARREALLNED